MKALAKITDAQRFALGVLAELGGWTSSHQLFQHKANPAAAMALVKHGLVEQRDVHSPNQSWTQPEKQFRKEWRAVAQEVAP